MDLLSTFPGGLNDHVNATCRQTQHIGDAQRKIAAANEGNDAANDQGKG